MKNKFKIDITEDFSAMISVLNINNGTYKTKNISLDDLIDCLQYVKNNSDVKTTRMQRGESDVMYISPVFSSRNGVSIVQHIIYSETEHLYILKKDSSKVMFNYYNDTYDVHVPSSLFVIKIKDEVIASARVFSLKEDFVDEDTEVFSYPFSNVYENGRICFGNNRLAFKKFKTFKDILSIPAMFFAMPSTHELACRNEYKMEYKVLLQHLEENKFDVTKLKSEKKQVKDLYKL